jgi:histidinol-phosphatase (PHP family)
MKYIDHHVHTEFSPDSDATLQGYLESGVRELMVTDHVDLGSPDPMFEEDFNYEAYSKQIKTLEKIYDAKISVGVEMGYQRAHLEIIESFVAAHPFDFVIGSIHFGDGLDFYNGEFFIGKTQKESYQRYFEIVLDMVERFENFDVVGHLDYITRYGDFEEKTYAYEDYEEVIEKILKCLVEKKKGIEINTSGKRNALDVFHPSEQIIKRYWELGGRIITLGSDAHRVEDHKDFFPQAIEMLKSIGVTHLTLFDKRIPEKVMF